MQKLKKELDQELQKNKCLCLTTLFWVKLYSTHNDFNYIYNLL